MKASLEYDLPDDWDEFNMASRAQELYFSLRDMDRWLRDKIKYEDATQLQEVRDELHVIMCQHGVDLEMMR